MKGVLELTTAPTIEPVSLDEVKAHSRIASSADYDDVLIKDKITAVRQMIEANYSIACVTQTWKLWLEQFPCNDIEIEKRPVQSITSVKYLDASAVLQTITSTDYITDLKHRPPRIVLAPGKSWPSVPNIRPDAVVIEFKAGYGDTAATVPANIKNFILIKIADFYEQRESFNQNKLQPVDFTEGLIASERLYNL